MNDQYYQPTDELDTSNPPADDFTWTDDKIIDFVNWYVKLHGLPFRYTLENRNIIESFKKGESYKQWNIPK